jgi:hypothetical protein
VVADAETAGKPPDNKLTGGQALVGSRHWFSKGRWIMQTTQKKTPWESHDWRVKTLESVSAGGGSKLGYTCRACERQFIYTTANNRAWAIRSDGTALADEVTTRWLGESCLRRPGEHDSKDKLKLKNPIKSDAPK